MAERDYLIRGAEIVAPNRVFHGDIAVRDGRITAVGKVRPPASATVINARGLLALPGFVNLHVHGAVGFDATSGAYDPKTDSFDSSPGACRRLLPEVMKQYARRGVTRALLATWAAPLRQLERAYASIADYADSMANGRDGARLEGIFPEGTFISNPAFCGAMNPANFLPPAIKTFDAMQRAARGHIRYINIAPEGGKAAEKLIKHVNYMGVVPGMAHTSCPAEQVLKCVRLGLRVCHHFLNGPTGGSFKPFGGGDVIEAVLDCPELYAELICDGWHINPRYVLDVVARKGRDRVAVVTDSGFQVGMKAIKKFTLGGVKGRVHPGGGYLEVVGKPGTLFGSVLTMDRAFANLLSWLTGDLDGIWGARRRPMPRNRALVHVARACSTNPAALLNLDNNIGVGRLAAGRQADIVLAKLTGRPGKYALKVKHTFVEGRKVV